MTTDDRKRDLIEAKVIARERRNMPRLEDMARAALAGLEATQKPISARVTIPEHLSKRDELRPSIRQLLVEEARAENDRRRGDEARRLRAAAEEGKNREEQEHD